MKGLIAKKVGMTQVFDESGNLTPVTVIRVEPNTVVATKTKETCGYDAVVLGVDDMKSNKANKAYAGIFPENVSPKRTLKEFRDFEKEVKVGDSVGLELFNESRFLDVTATSKGKGFQGVMKRWGFHGGRATHGSKFHREPGGTGNCTTPGHCFKNTKLPGRMGFRRVTVQNLKIVKIDPELNVILVRGAVPGNKDCTLIVKSAVKKLHGGIRIMEKKVYSTDGKELRTITLDDKVFGLPVNDDVIYYAITNELANMRVGTACTKGRAEVHGSNAKPYKQKGTGNARRGDKKSPIMVGGGTIFGPKPRDFSYSMPKKAKRLAMKSILSMQAQSDRFTVVEDFTVESGKTKDLVKILDNFVKGERTVIVLKDDDAKIKQAGRNIPSLSFLSYNRLRAHDLYYARKIVILEGAVKNLSDFYAEDKEAE